MAGISAIALLASAALVFDLGRVVFAAQRAQDAADAAARACMVNFPSVDLSGAGQRIADTVSANSATTRMPITYASSETVYYSGGATAPGFGTLGAGDEGVTVTTHIPINFYFARAVGLNGTTVTRTSTAVTAQAAGASVVPLWITETTPYNYGQQTDLLMASAPCVPGIAGNFGWLTPPSGSNDFQTMLSGYNVSPDLLAANYVTAGQTVCGLTGEKTGQWVSALDAGTNTTGRLLRATWPPWTDDTFANYHKDNPRLMIVPICQYVTGTGSSAQFTVVKLGVFWLESVGSGGKSITGRFVRYTIPAAGASAGNTFTGIWTTRVTH